MNIVSSYHVKINKTGLDKQVIKQTYKIYKSAVSYFIPLINKEYNCFLQSDVRIVNFVEKLSHKTKNNPNPKYDFDSLFYKFPSDLRRAAISDAYGIVQSYRAKLDDYKLSKSKNRPPKLQYKHNKMPTFYSSLFKWIDKYKCKIKVFKNNDWVWLNLNLRPSDVRYINKHDKILSPRLKVRHNNYYFVFPVKDKVKLNNKDDLVMGVDLGLNSLATLCIMDKKGTIYKRFFINNKKETDLLNHLLNKKKKYQKKSLDQNAIYREINSCQDRIEKYVVNEIINIAKDNKVNVIVLEYLSLHFKAKGSYKEKLHLWRKKAIFNRLAHKAHLNKIRYSSVLARNTSKLAFDGSDVVIRDKKNYSLSYFQNGKQYNCDLNASYNIAARYYIREILNKIKTLDKNISLRSVLEAKVPTIFERTNNTLSDLINLNVVIENSL